MHKYCYDDAIFARSVTFTGGFCLLIVLYSLVMLFTGSYLFWIFLLVGLYQVFNTFVSISNPKEVVVEEDAISFSAYGKTHRYPLDEITSLRIKELDYHKKMYLRINEAGMMRGRYWIACKHMNDGAELWDYLAWLEYQKEPDQVKFRARVPKKPQENTVNLTESSSTDDVTINETDE